MIPRILEYEDGRIVVTAEAYSIPEIKAILDKYELKADPYLAYIHLITSPNSPYVNLSEEDDEKNSTVIYDVIQTHGDFDIDDKLIRPAIQRLEKLYTSPTKVFYDGLKESILRMGKILKNEPITFGKDGSVSDIRAMQEKGAMTIRNFKDIEKQVDEELTTKMRGKNILGDY